MILDCVGVGIVAVLGWLVRSECGGELMDNQLAVSVSECLLVNGMVGIRRMSPQLSLAMMVRDSCDVGSGRRGFNT